MSRILAYSWHLMLAVFVAVQINFWVETRPIKPTLEVVNEPLTGNYLQALAMGDNQLVFRSTSFMIQNMGDTWGRFTSLRMYDLGRLSRWFAAMDTLDARSDMMPALASYYFSQNQKEENIHYITQYLYNHATRDVPRKWWWILQGMYLASHKENNPDLTLAFAKHLMNPAVPVWAQQMLAVTYEKRGEFDDALRIMEGIRDNTKNIPERDLRFMTYFVEERLKRMEEFKKSNRNNLKNGGAPSE